MKRVACVKEERDAWIIIAMSILLASILLSYAFDQDKQICGMGVLLASLTLWLSESVPISISSLFMLSILPFLGLMSYEDVISNFGTNTALFIMASSGITVAISKSCIPNMLTSQVIKRTGEHSIRLLYSVGILVTLFSAFVSSLATCALFTSLVSAILKNSNIRPRESVLGKGLMLTIPACAGIGGFMSPAGTPANILVIDILAKKSIDLPFYKWCIVGFPVGITASLIFISSVAFVFRPERIKIQMQENEAVSLGKKDKAIILIVLLVIVGWFASSFVSFLNTTIVAVIGLSLLFIPQLHILDMEKFSRGVNWDLVVSMGTVSVLMTAISNTGLLTNISIMLLRNFTKLSPILLLPMISMCICLMRAFVPTTTAVIALFAPILISVAEMSNQSVAVLLLIASFWAAAALLLVYTEPIYLIAYNENFFEAKDLLRAGAIPSLVLSLIASYGIYFMAQVVGFN